MHDTKTKIGYEGHSPEREGAQVSLFVFLLDQTFGCHYYREVKLLNYYRHFRDCDIILVQWHSLKTWLEQEVELNKRIRV